MTEIFLDALSDNIKLIPVLYVTYYIMEYMEHKMSKKTKDLIVKSGKAGPLYGGVIGMFPQCGFSAAAASFYSGGVITLGTLLAVFLSTSDEMLPILISETVPAVTIVKILGAKVLIGICGGFAVDLVLPKLGKGHVVQKQIHEMCEHEHCHCDESASIWKSALNHTVKVAVFIFLAAVVLNGVMVFGGEEALTSFLFDRPVMGTVITGLVGLIPNCAASVIITQLYLEHVIGSGAMMAGLLVGAGVGLLVLFRVNQPLKQNVKILGLLYCIGTAAGIIIELTGITF